MRLIKKATAFKKGFKQSLKRNLPEQAFVDVVTALATDIELPARCRPHKLVREYTGM